jgi:uncharacterized protein (UPF0335 family)
MSGAPSEEKVLAGMAASVASLRAEKEKVPSLAPPKPKVEAADEKKRLRSIVDRIVRLEEERASLGNDVKEIYTEAKSAGYSKKALRIVVKREMEDADARAAREASETEAELIMSALGEFASSPLGEFAISRGKH